MRRSLAAAFAAFIAACAASPALAPAPAPAVTTTTAIPIAPVTADAAAPAPVVVAPPPSALVEPPAPEPSEADVARGPLGPKGDGTCVRTYQKKSAAAPCPELAKVLALPDDQFSPIACDWAAACGIMGDEGCCVGCKHPMRMKIARACATKMLRAKTCAEVQKLSSAPSCHR